jgi:hypothetical protein
MMFMIFKATKIKMKGNIFCFLMKKTFTGFFCMSKFAYLKILSIICNLLICNLVIYNLGFAQQTNNLEVIWVKTGPDSVIAFGRCIASGDVNSDGFSDVMIVGDSIVGQDSYVISDYRGKCWIYFGGTNFDTISDVQLLNTQEYTFFSLHSTDINSDGNSDVMIGACNNLPSEQVLVFTQLSQGQIIDSTPDYILRGPYRGSGFGAAISSGDVNGDGYSDLIIGAPGILIPPVGELAGRVYIYFGGPNFDTIPDVILNGGHNNMAENFGQDIGISADCNSDGYEDAIIGALAYGAWQGRMYIYYGGNPMNTTADVTLTGEGPSQHLTWGAISSLSNSVGFDYAMAGTSMWPRGWAYDNPGKIYILFGGNPMDSIPDVCMVGRMAASGLSMSLSRSGYITSSLFDGVISGAAQEPGNCIGCAYIWQGEPNLDTIPDAWLRGLQYDDGIGWAVASAGDVNGDGRDEIMISNYASNYSPKRVWICKYTGVGIEEARGRKQEARNLKIYPNPAKSIIRVSCPWFVKEIRIYDISGKMVKIIETRGRRQEVGALKQVQGEVTWNLKDENRKKVSTGIYFIELIAEQEKERIREIRKITVIK